MSRSEVTKSSNLECTGVLEDGIYYPQIRFRKGVQTISVPTYTVHVKNSEDHSAATEITKSRGKANPTSHDQASQATTPLPQPDSASASQLTPSSVSTSLSDSRFLAWVRSLKETGYLPLDIAAMVQDLELLAEYGDALTTPQGVTIEAGESTGAGNTEGSGVDGADGGAEKAVK